MIEQSITYLTAILLGIMLFFSFVIAPSTFRFLNEEYARKFIRGIFALIIPKNSKKKELKDKFLTKIFRLKYLLFSI